MLRQDTANSSAQLLVIGRIVGGLDHRGEHIDQIGGGSAMLIAQFGELVASRLMHARDPFEKHLHDLIARAPLRLCAETEQKGIPFGRIHMVGLKIGHIKRFGFSREMLDLQRQHMC